jgi:hypothetical protein
MWKATRTGAPFASARTIRRGRRPWHVQKLLVGEPGGPTEVESRAGTKRNAGGQTTHRTLGRARVTQALARVRKAAQQRRKEKFTALYHHLSVDLLREAFLVLKRDVAPGWTA